MCQAPRCFLSFLLFGWVRHWAVLTSTSFSGTKELTFLYFCCHPSQVLLSFMESFVGTPQSVASQKLLHPPVDFKRSESQPGVGPLSNVPFSYISCLSSLICYSFIPQGSLYPLVGNMLLLVFMCVCPITSDSLWPHELSLPGSSVHGIIQARRLERVAICFSRGSSWTRDGTLVSFIGRWVLYHWATREAQYYLVIVYINFLLLKLLFLFADWTLTQNWYQK